jgi:hypothetical protein
MKKLLFVLALGAFAACGAGANKDNAADSAAKLDSAAKIAVDSVKHEADTAVHAIDSTVKAAKDSLKK